jgi:hypothetical protein
LQIFYKNIYIAVAFVVVIAIIVIGFVGWLSMPDITKKFRSSVLEENSRVWLVT